MDDADFLEVGDGSVIDVFVEGGDGLVDGHADEFDLRRDVGCFSEGREGRICGSASGLGADLLLHLTTVAVCSILLTQDLDVIHGDGRLHDSHLDDQVTFCVG